MDCNWLIGYFSGQWPTGGAVPAVLLVLSAEGVAAAEKGSTSSHVACRSQAADGHCSADAVFVFQSDSTHQASDLFERVVGIACRGGGCGDGHFAGPLGVVGLVALGDSVDRESLL